MGIASKTVHVAAVMFLLLLAATGRAEWKQIGLADREVASLEIDNGTFYAATDNGVYRSSISSPVPAWEPIGLQGLSIRSLLIINGDTILAGLTEGSIAIYRTTNAGLIWQPYVNGYGGSGFEPVFALAKVPNQGDTIFATGVAVVAKSTNGGISWLPVWGGWQGMAMGTVFVQVDGNDHQIVWAGGEGGFFNPWLLKSTDGGESFSFLSIVNTGDNRCHDVAIDPTNSDMVYTSMEGQIQKTTNGGQSWVIVEENPFYLYGIEIDPLRPAAVFACGAQTGRRLTFFASFDHGRHWWEFAESSHDENPAFDIDLLRVGAQRHLYFATRHGIYLHTSPADWICGDANMDGEIDISDAVFLITYIFAGGAAPEPEAIGDANCDGAVDISDAVYLIAYIFSGGPEPCAGCK